MKIINEQHLNTLVASIIAEKEKQAETIHQTFTGITQDDLFKEIEARLGGKWALKKEKPIKFSKDDINAVANSRFYRKTGIKLLMLVVIALLAFSILTNNFRILPINVYYGLCAGLAVGFVYLYSRKQSKARKELWKEIGREEIEDK